MSMMSGARLDNCLGKVYAVRHEIADRFYELLFREMPEVAELFHGDFHKQKEMFSMMCALMARGVAKAEDPAVMGAQMRDHHAHLPVSAEQYSRGGALLLLAFCDVLEGISVSLKRRRWVIGSSA